MENNLKKYLLDTIKSENTNFEFIPISSENASSVLNLYKTYEGKKEFLYIPPKDEIEDTLKSDKECYLGVYNKGTLIGVRKISLLKESSPFFVPPQYEKENGTYFGLSGLYVHPNYRRHKLGYQMSKIAWKTAYKMNATGVYADCDYANNPSFSLLSSSYNLAGFTDGTNGAEGEKTIYVRWYHSFHNRPHKVIPSIDLEVIDEKDLKTTVQNFAKKMSQLAPLDIQKISYGGKDKYNTLYTFAQLISFEQVNLYMPTCDKPIVYKKKHAGIPPLNIGDSRIRQ